MTKPIPALALVERACRFLGTSHAQLTDSSRRQKPFVRMRWAVMWVLRTQNPDHSLRMIGRPVGINDHNSVLYVLRKCRDLIAARDVEFIGTIEALKAGRWQSPTFWVDRPGRSHPACEALFDMIPLDDAKLDHFGNQRAYQMVRGGGCGGDPALKLDEINRRRIETERARAEREAACLAAERARYGITRQTRSVPLSRQVA